MESAIGGLLRKGKANPTEDNAGKSRVVQRGVWFDDAMESAIGGLGWHLRLRLALESSKSGSRYGHYVLGTLYGDQDGNNTFFVAAGCRPRP
jgi:hypothetical protein